MLPYVTQGARQEIEDAGVLAIFLSLADEVNTVFRVYGRERRERVEAIQRSVRKTGMVLRLVDGVQ